LIRCLRRLLILIDSLDTSGTSNWCHVYTMDMMYFMMGPDIYVPQQADLDNGAVANQAMGNEYVGRLPVYGGSSRGFLMLSGEEI